MPEGPTIIVFKKRIEKFEGKTVTESDGYRNPFAEKISGQKLLDISSKTPVTKTLLRSLDIKTVLL